MQSSRLRASLPWIGLVCVLCAFIVTVVRLHPTNFFGMSEDDTFYFSSAEAIAHGQGYVMPSLPGAPVATKYPQLYPWLLSYVWWANPSFPGNLVDAVGLSICFGLTFLTLVFFFLKQPGRLTAWEALAITAFCAFQPVVVLFSGSVLTEIPFAAIVIAGLVVADRAIWPDARLAWALSCGVLAGLSAEMRVLGFALVAGIGIAAILRRAWRQLFVFSLSTGVLLVPVVWRQLFVRAMAPASIAQHAGPGWMTVWIYDTSYVGVWRAGVPNLHIFFAMLINNFKALLATPSYYLLADSPLMGGELGVAAWAVVTTMIVAAFVRQVRRSGWSPLCCTFVLYTGIAMLWSYNSYYRFFVPFLPIFVAGYWSELKHLGSMAWQALASRKILSDVVAATVLTAAIVAGNAVIAWPYLGGRGRAKLKALSDRRAGLLSSEREAYRWISGSTPTNARIVAYQDAQLYLYTQRQSMRPIVFTTAELLEPNRLPRDLEHMTDVARAIGAGYWFVSDDDFGIEWSRGREGAEQRIRAMETVLPLVFRSSDGRVSIYGLGCVENPATAGCDRADAVLFPNGAGNAGY